MARAVSALAVAVVLASAGVAYAAPANTPRTTTTNALTRLVTKFQHRTDSYPVGDPSFRVQVNSTQAGTDGTLATLLHGTEPIGRATMAGGTALITPTKRTDSANLSVALERDGFIATTRPVSAPVPNLTLTCPTEVNVPGEDNIQVSGKVTPLVSGATVRFKAIRPNGTVTTHSTQTGSASTYAVKLTPMSTADIGTVTVQAFYDGALKYGADDASCIVPVN